MGKEPLSFKNINSPLLHKSHRTVYPIRKCFSTSQIIHSKQKRSERIISKIRKQLKKILRKHSSMENTKKLQSVLNLRSEKQIVCSAVNIPSIQNMISMDQLRSYGDANSELQSIISFVQSEQFYLQPTQPELMISYLYLVEKAIKTLGITLASRQNEKVIKAIWNLLYKFWMDTPKDNDKERIYQGINQKIEWGLFDLLNFNLSLDRREIFQKQSELTSLSYLK